LRLTLVTVLLPRPLNQPCLLVQTLHQTTQIGLPLQAQGPLLLHLIPLSTPPLPLILLTGVVVVFVDEGARPFGSGVFGGVIPLLNLLRLRNQHISKPKPSDPPLRRLLHMLLAAWAGPLPRTAFSSGGIYCVLERVLVERFVRFLFLGVVYFDGEEGGLWGDGTPEAVSVGYYLLSSDYFGIDFSLFLFFPIFFYIFHFANIRQTLIFSFSNGFPATLIYQVVFLRDFLTIIKGAGADLDFRLDEFCYFYGGGGLTAGRFAADIGVVGGFLQVD